MIDLSVSTDWGVQALIRQRMIATFSLTFFPRTNESNVRWFLSDNLILLFIFNKNTSNRLWIIVLHWFHDRWFLCCTLAQNHEAEIYMKYSYKRFHFQKFSVLYQHFQFTCHRHSINTIFHIYIEMYSNSQIQANLSVINSR